MKYNVEIDCDGDEHWEIQLGGDFEYHREIGPAIIYAVGSKIWYKNGKLHRDGDLPAAIYASSVKEWWVNGEFIKRRR